MIIKLEYNRSNIDGIREEAFRPACRGAFRQSRNQNGEDFRDRRDSKRGESLIKIQEQMKMVKGSLWIQLSRVAECFAVRGTRHSCSDI